MKPLRIIVTPHEVFFDVEAEGNDDVSKGKDRFYVTQAKHSLCFTPVGRLLVIRTNLSQL